jgi:hypothetical protein
MRLEFVVKELYDKNEHSPLLIAFDMKSRKNSSNFNRKVLIYYFDFSCVDGCRVI